jgi:DNA-binding transcriptional LysR family regulator
MDLRMELRQLRHFVAVAEERSFTGASRRLHLVQSAVSVSIKTLETELGSPLFERTTRQLRLTDSGSALLPEARLTLAAAEAAQDAVHAVAGGLRGSLRIGIMQSLPLLDLAGLITAFHGARPHVQILPKAALGGSIDLVDDVVSGVLDLAFVSVVDPAPPSVNLRTLTSAPIRLAVPTGHRFAGRTRVELGELAVEAFIETPTGWGLRAASDRALEQAGVVRDIRLEVADLSTVIELVRAGLGLGLIPEPSPVPIEGVTLVPVHPEPTFTVSLATPKERRPSAAARAFIEIVDAQSWPS